MSDLDGKFQTATEEVKSLPARPDNQTLLELYAYFKQATVGDVSGKRPGMIDFAGRAKYDAWGKLKGTDKSAAMQAYIDLVERLKAGAGR